MKNVKRHKPNAPYTDSMFMTEAGNYVIIYAQLFLFISPCFLRWFLLYWTPETNIRRSHIAGGKIDYFLFEIY